MASPVVTITKAPPKRKSKRDRSADDTDGDQRVAKRVGDIKDFNDIIVVLVGPDEERFSIHQEAICDKSKFFKAACSKRWQSGTEKVVCLPEVEPEEFRQYCKWVYSGLFPAIHCTGDSQHEEIRAERHIIISLYLLGDSIDDIELRKAATHAFATSLYLAEAFPPPAQLATIWSSTPVGSLFRKLIVVYTVVRVDRDQLAHRITAYPAEFVQEVAVAALHKFPPTSWKIGMGNISDFLESE